MVLWNAEMTSATQRYEQASSTTLTCLVFDTTMHLQLSARESIFTTSATATTISTTMCHVHLRPSRFTRVQHNVRGGRVSGVVSLYFLLQHVLNSLNLSLRDAKR